MRLKIKNQESLPGTPIHRGGDRARWLEAAAPGALRPFEILKASSIRRSLKMTLQELREAGLQMLAGTIPYVPRLKVREGKNALTVSAKLRGVDGESIDVAFEGEGITIHGTQARYREHTRRRFQRIEKTLRTFHRVIPLSSTFERGAAVATFSGNVLRINVPKAAPASRVQGSTAPAQTTPAGATEPVQEMAVAGE
jgi:HSP20 family molecular chaperone IbpA